MSGFGAWNGFAIEVTAKEKNKEYQLIFDDGKGQRVLRLWEGPVGKSIYRGLGFQGGWYVNGFMDVEINKKRVLGEPNQEKYPLYDRCEVLENGQRALAQYIWERDDATVRLRFLMRPECRALLAELVLEPKKKIESLIIHGSSFPGAYTGKHEGERRMKTGLREERSVTNVTVNVKDENWMLFCDNKYDKANPTYGRFAGNGCAGLYVYPEGIEKMTVNLTGYPIDLTMTASSGVTMLRLAFDNLDMANSNAFKVMQEEAPKVRQLLKEETFQQTILASFNPDEERKKTDQLPGQGCSCNRRKVLVSEALDKAIIEVNAFRKDSTKPISGEQRALAAIDHYRRHWLTASRYADQRIRVFELRGPGYSKYQVAKAITVPGKGMAEVAGGYFSTSGGFGVSPFPGTVEEMYRYDVILILDVETRALVPQNLQLLRQYVEDGGGIIIFGGLYSYGASNIKETPLAELLPFTIEKAPLGHRRSPPDAVLKLQDFQRFAGPVEWPDNLVSPWYHELVPVKEIHTWIKNGDMPWLASREFGQGRVIACAGNLLGEAKGDRKAFYQWEGWPEVMWKMIKWTSGKN